jgi:hypothetical protein
MNIFLKNDPHTSRAQPSARQMMAHTAGWVETLVVELPERFPKFALS